jgi:hypothetical protein
MPSFNRIDASVADGFAPELLPKRCTGSSCNFSSRVTVPRLANRANAVELVLVRTHRETISFRDALLELLDARLFELADGTALHADEVVMVCRVVA